MGKTSDLYREGKPLGRRGFFQLVTDEVYRKGELDALEVDLLSRLASFLKIDGDQAQGIAGLSKKKFEAKELGPPRKLDPTKLYERVLFYVLSDGEVDPKEEKLLKMCRSLWKIPPSEHDRIWAKVGSASPIELDPEPEPEPEREPEPRAKPEPAAPTSAPIPSPSPPSRGKASPPKKSRLAGDKAGSKSYPLRPGGVPIPNTVQVQCVLAGGFAVALASAVLALVGFHLTPKGWIVVGGGAYWLLRRFLEGGLLPPDAKLVIQARKLEMPAVFAGEAHGGVVVVSREEITGLTAKSQDGTTFESLIIHSRDHGNLQFFPDCFDGSIEGVARDLESYLMKPLKVDANKDVPKPLQYLVLGILLLILGLLLLALLAP